MWWICMCLLDVWIGGRGGSVPGAGSAGVLGWGVGTGVDVGVLSV